MSASIVPGFSQIAYLQRALAAHVPQKMLRDLLNWLRYGVQAPRSDARIYVDPKAMSQALARQERSHRFKRQNSGALEPGDWDLARVDIETNTKLRSCRMHWQMGADWPETPIWQRLAREIAGGHTPDGCVTLGDLKDRYLALDRLFSETRSRGRLLTRDEMPDHFRREHGGVLVHVARDGTCLRSGGGAHRFAVARILGLPEIPAQIGAVHPGAIQNGHLQQLLLSRFAQDGKTGDAA
ncbi:hypothetical protein [Tropicibacter sp. S64]|uniref:hypothetical protein n=1 Tax=Tropicibacter sp. S64 TaxID=3415122 RepID=UPI003C7C68CB